jgi:hypothetical protein
MMHFETDFKHHGLRRNCRKLWKGVFGGKVTPGKGIMPVGLFFFWRLDCLEHAVEQQVVNDLQTSGQKKRQTQKRCVGKQRSGKDG